MVGQSEPDPKLETLLPGVTLTLIAEHPDIATPTGIDVDAEGNIWAVACHTHMPPDDYPGPKFDEILVFSPDGKQRSVFYNATYHTMDLELGADGWVYLAERDRILRIKDTDGDGKADVEEDLATLTTEADYPHNGLSGLCWHPDGDLIFGLGENFAQGWSLRSVDNLEISGSGEGGVFRCRPDGTELHRIARGMWNPFGICVRADGEIFATDNDPGVRPPCRLLHVVEGGDYAYQRKYGSEAHHPFVGWNGELRGSLPMVHPVGEAPCGAASLGRGLIVPSWSDHRIDFHALHREGASFAGERLQLIGGLRYFRPVCIAEDKTAASEESRTWYLTDWVDGRYPVHGFGRLWRLDIDLQNAANWIGPTELEPRTPEAELAADLLSGDSSRSRDELLTLSRHEDPFVARAGLIQLADLASNDSPAEFSALPKADQISTVLALSLGKADPANWIPPLLDSATPEVVFETLRWIADAELTEFQSAVESLLTRNDLSFDVFEAAIATSNTLSGTPDQGVRNPEAFLTRVQDSASPPHLRAFALRLLPIPAQSPSKAEPNARVRYPKGLTVALLEELLTIGDEQLSLEAARVLAGRPDAGAALLAQVANDPEQTPPVRAEAIAGLAVVAPDHLDLLVSLAAENAPVIREEALRALRNRPLSEEQRAEISKSANAFPESAALFQALLDPTSLAAGRPGIDQLDAWIARLDAVEGEPDLSAGERIFHHASVALCSNCHRHGGRGNIVGPDLSAVADRGDHRWLLDSILQPAKEIAPEYLPRTMTLKDGRQVTGIRLRSSTSEVIRDAHGQSLSFKKDDIAKIEELNTSFMPAGLIYTLTDRELRDLMAFLESES